MKTQKEIAENERATWNNNSNKKYFSEEDIKKVIDKNLKDLHEKLANPELPDMCQANLSGAIIWLESLKKEITR